MTNRETPADAMDVRLRDTVEGDLPTLFEFQLDPEANRMSAVKPRSREAFMTLFTKLLGDASLVKKTILVNGQIAGSAGCFVLEGKFSVGYSIAREHWGKGIMTRALRELLTEVTTRPLYARIARANLASARVLEKCGFKVIGYEMSAESERYVACEEAIWVLE